MDGASNNWVKSLQDLTLPVEDEMSDQHTADSTESGHSHRELLKAT